MPLGQKAQKFYNENYKNSSNSENTFNIIEFRRSVGQYFNEKLGKIVVSTDIERSKKILNFSGHKVEATLYVPKNARTPMPVIIFHPGGGLALDMADLHSYACIGICQAAEAAVICIQPELSAGA